MKQENKAKLLGFLRETLPWAHLSGHVVSRRKKMKWKDEGFIGWFEYLTVRFGKVGTSE